MPDTALVAQITAVLVVDRVEPCIEFWHKLGFELTAQVPHDDAIGFAMLASGDTLLMYQSTASVAADLVASMSAPGAWRGEPQQHYLFVKVPDLDAAEAALTEETLVMPRRKTFYGATETGYLDPAGNVVVLAQM